ncbi:DUF1488 domain-containing protein [uncultured Ralstonia sp.]|jgi:hypothetical protein|uniref:DUF1488 domain-containing protein n=1 Tax=Ralstonia sp. TaxID=54061 RepID=UPI001EA5EF70|nr:DUF1488 domain-containing protein [uncultured Ralstonia sp.]UCF22122.1 MAG: DUF1488 domain-containing protein [Ralstonia sp.]
MEIKFESKEEYPVNNEGLLFDALVDGEKVTCVATREALWAGLDSDQVMSLQAAFEAGRERIQDAARVLIADGVQRAHGLEDLPQPVVVKVVHIASA